MKTKTPDEDRSYHYTWRPEDIVVEQPVNDAPADAPPGHNSVDR